MLFSENLHSLAPAPRNCGCTIGCAASSSALPLRHLWHKGPFAILQHRCARALPPSTTDFTADSHHRRKKQWHTIKEAINNPHTVLHHMDVSLTTPRHRHKLSESQIRHSQAMASILLLLFPMAPILWHQVTLPRMLLHLIQEIQNPSVIKPPKTQ